jgi:hypothetical protein
MYVASKNLSFFLKRSHSKSILSSFSINQNKTIYIKISNINAGYLFNSHYSFFSRVNDRRGEINLYAIVRN